MPFSFFPSTRVGPYNGQDGPFARAARPYRASPSGPYFYYSRLIFLFFLYKKIERQSSNDSLFLSLSDKGMIMGLI